MKPMFSGFGKGLVVAGLLIAAAGVFVILGVRLPWLGRLPGDVSIKRGNFSFYFPFTTCLLLSVALTLLLRLFKK
jgi:hypothetical protein